MQQRRVSDRSATAPAANTIAAADGVYLTGVSVPLLPEQYRRGAFSAPA